MIFDWQHDAYRYPGTQGFTFAGAVGQMLVYVGLVVMTLWPRSVAGTLRDRSLAMGLWPRSGGSLRDRSLDGHLLDRDTDWTLEEVRP
jgi:hypothetical protein